MAEKIIHIPRRFVQSEWGGTESVLVNICREQQKAGFNPIIHTSCALSKPGKEKWENLPIVRHRYCYPFLGLSKADKLALDKKGGNLISLCLLRNLIKEKNVRLYHAHVTKRMGGTVLVAARKNKKPCVVTLHGNMFDVPKAEQNAVIQAQKGHFDWGRLFGAFLKSRTLLNEADAIICVGHSEYLAASKALGHGRVHYLPNGVTPTTFQGGSGKKARAALGIPPSAWLLGCISRLDPQKDQISLIRALAQVRKNHPEAHLLLAGPETVAGYKDALLKEAATWGVQEALHLTDAFKPESDELRDALASLNAFCLPSRHEPFGIVILEAWSAHLPIITSTAGGLAHLVENEKDGLTFPAEDVDALAAAWIKLIDNPTLAKNLAQAGALKVDTEYTWPKVAEALEVIYQKAELVCARNQAEKRF